MALFSEIKMTWEGLGLGVKLTVLMDDLILQCKDKKIHVRSS